VGALRPVRPTWTRAHVLATALLAIAVPAAAQPTAPPGATPNRPDNGRSAALTARYHVRQMENVLERAVQHAADMMRRRLQAVTPDVLALAGAPRAQGFRIDGYGLFFSVEVPRLSESVNWALKVLSQDSDERVLASLQKVATSEQDPLVRADLERAMRTIQMQLAAISRVTASPPATSAPRRTASPSQASVTSAPVPSLGPAPPAVQADRAAPVGSAEASASGQLVAPAPAPSTAASATTAPAPPSPPAAAMSTAPAVSPAEEPAPAAPMGDPSVAYEDEVKQALVDAMLDYAGSLPLPAVEWVTVAARDAGYVAFPDAVSDMVTVTLSVRVSDLLDFRAQRLTREEARTRVVVREF
jgi:hypothetical protein